MDLPALFVAAILNVQVTVKSITYETKQETKQTQESNTTVLNGNTKAVPDRYNGNQMDGRTSNSGEESVTTQSRNAILQEIKILWGEKAWQAEKVFFCESGLRADAASSSGDFGIGQINLKAHWDKIPGQTREDKISWLLIPSNNLRLAYSLYLAQSWSPWRSSRHCHHLA